MGVSDWIALIGVIVNSILAYWIVRTIQNKLTNKRVLKDHFINEIKEIRNDYKTCLNNLYLNTTHPHRVIPWFKLMNIKVTDLMTLINTKYKIDKDKLKPYQIELQELITNNEDFMNQYSKADKNDFPFASIRVNRASRPISPAAVTGLPLGKLIGIEGNNAVISNEPIETYTLTAPITINNDLFNADAELDFYSASGVLEILNHVMVAADDGKVQPVNLAFSDFNSDILNTYRNQIVGIAIGSAGTEVKVIKLAYVSHVLHLFRRAFAKGILGND